MLLLLLLLLLLLFRRQRSKILVAIGMKQQRISIVAEVPPDPP
jgi:hypothetical protein